MTYLFLKGLIISFFLAIPVGPIGLIFINRTIHQGFLISLFTGLGIASIDAIYGAIPAFGLSYLSNFLIHNQPWLRLIFGAVILLMAIKIWRIQPNTKVATEIKKVDYLHAFTTIFLLGLPNPMMIVAYIAVFIGLGLENQLINNTAATTLVIGFFIGSFLWWLAFAGFIQLFRKKSLKLAQLNWVNKISAVLLAGFGIWILLDLLIGL